MLARAHRRTTTPATAAATTGAAAAAAAARRPRVRARKESSDRCSPGCGFWNRGLQIVGRRVADCGSQEHGGGGRRREETWFSRLFPDTYIRL
eukprot:14504825-Alexandrium_andersonii.AAC.1